MFVDIGNPLAGVTVTVSMTALVHAAHTTAMPLLLYTVTRWTTRPDMPLATMACI